MGILLTSRLQYITFVIKIYILACMEVMLAIKFFIFYFILCVAMTYSQAKPLTWVWLEFQHCSTVVERRRTVLLVILPNENQSYLFRIRVELRRTRTVALQRFSITGV
jgi:hypothetical protein